MSISITSVMLIETIHRRYQSWTAIIMDTVFLVAIYFSPLCHPSVTLQRAISGPLPAVKGSVWRRAPGVDLSPPLDFRVHVPHPSS